MTTVFKRNVSARSAPVGRDRIAARPQVPWFELAIGAGFAVVWLWSLAFAPIVPIDDGFVFLRYARNLVDYGELAWNLGSVGTDGFTSIAQVMSIALLYSVLGGDILASGWLVGLVASTATMLLLLLVVRSAMRPRAWRPGRQPGPLAVASVLGLCATTTALSPYAAFWAHSVMDAPLSSFVYLLGSIAAVELVRGNNGSGGFGRPVVAGLGLTAMALARPEALLVALVLLGLSFLHLARVLSATKRAAAVRAFAGLATASVLIGSYIAWHCARYGHFFPNPVYVKTRGVSLATFLDGISELWRGPAYGFLPLGLYRLSQDGTSSWVPFETVHIAISAEQPAYPYLGVIALALALFALSFVERCWLAREHRLRTRSLLLVPLGLLVVFVSAGGDGPAGGALYVGWRMVTPILPAIVAAFAFGLPGLRPVLARTAVVVALIIVAPSAATLHLRPESCAAAANACGRQAIASWPLSRSNYAYDNSNGKLDAALADTLAFVLPPDTVLGQSDLLRIGYLTRFPVLDTSGLINAELAHGQHSPQLTLWTDDYILTKAPPIYFYGWEFISIRPLADYALDSPCVGLFLRPWSARSGRILAPKYLSASIRVDDRLFFNFLVHRDLAPRVGLAEKLLLGPVAFGEAGSNCPDGTLVRPV